MARLSSSGRASLPKLSSAAASTDAGKILLRANSDDQQMMQEIFDAVRGNPSALMHAGLANIISTVPSNDDEDASLHEAMEAEQSMGDGENLPSDAQLPEFTPKANLIKPLEMNLCQRKLDLCVEMSRAARLPIRIIVDKSRRVGFSTYVMARFSGRLATTSGVYSLVIAHQPRTALQIYRMSQLMLRSLPDWLRPAFTRNSKELLEVENRAWGVRSSRLSSIASTNIAAVHGEAALQMLYDEGSRYRNITEVEEAAASIGMPGPMSEIWWGSTGNGHDPFFYPRFEEAWQAQGRVNVWQPKATPFRKPRVAVFFPWYYDYKQTSLKLHHDVSLDELNRRLDDMEKMIVEQHLIPFWYEQGVDDLSHALSLSLLQINWRRAKLAYKDWPVLPLYAGSEFLDHRVFACQYPLTPEESFAPLHGAVVFREHLGKIDASIRAPKVLALNSDGQPVQNPLPTETLFWTWKDPKEVKGDVFGFFDAAEGVLDGNPVRLDYRRDMQAATFWEWDGTNLEQIGEYLSQRPGPLVGRDLLAFMRYWKGDRETFGRFGGNRRGGGVAIYAHFKQSNYPHDRLMLSRADDRPGRKELGGYGFVETVNTITNSVQHTLEWFHAERLIVRSPRLRQQIGWFVQKSDTKFEATNKGGANEQSKDDLVKTMCALVYMIQAYNWHSRVEILDELGDKELQERIRQEKILDGIMPEGFSSNNIQPLMDWIKAGGPAKAIEKEASEQQASKRKFFQMRNKDKGLL